MITQFIREPLVHFVVIGALIFAADVFWNADAAQEAAITLEDDRRADLAAEFQRRVGHEPSDEELADIADRWMTSEVLYREALALGLDRNDDSIRSHLIKKMRFVIQSSTNLIEAPAEDELIAWFEANKERYQTPLRYDFAVVKAGDEANAKAVLADLKKGGDTTSLDLPYKEYEMRIASNIEKNFGPEAAAKLTDADTGAWSMAPSPRGWHLLRLDQVREIPLTFEAHRQQVEQDWIQAERARLSKEAIDSLRASYQIPDPTS